MDDPYSTPNSDPSVIAQKPKTLKISFVTSWVVWTLLIFTWPVDIFVILSGGKWQKTISPDSFHYTFGFVSFFLIVLTFAIRWFALRFLLSKPKIITSNWATVIYVAGFLLIWGIVKIVEAFGLAIAFRDESLSAYLLFWIPSLIVMLIHLPNLIRPKC